MLVTMTTHLGKTWKNHFAKAEIFGIYIYRDLQCNFHHDKSQHEMRVKLTKGHLSYQSFILQLGTA